MGRAAGRILSDRISSCSSSVSVMSRMSWRPTLFVVTDGHLSFSQGVWVLCISLRAARTRRQEVLGGVDAWLAGGIGHLAALFLPCVTARVFKLGKGCYCALCFCFGYPRDGYPRRGKYLLLSLLGAGPWAQQAGKGSRSSQQGTQCKVGCWLFLPIFPSHTV